MTYFEPDNLTYELHVQKLHDKHVKAIQKVKPEVDMKDNQSAYNKYDRNSGKAKYLKQKREKEVENDNNILLQKIFGIISANSTYKKLPGPRSLNLVNRIRESKRINDSNRKMVSNLMNVEPTIRFTDKKRKEEIKKNTDLISKFKRKQKNTKFVENYIQGNFKKPADERAVIFSSIGQRRAQSAGAIHPSDRRSNPRDIVLDQIKQTDENIDNKYLSGKDYKNQLSSLLKKVNTQMDSPTKSKSSPRKKQKSNNIPTGILIKNDDESSNKSEMYQSNLSSKAGKKVTIIASKSESNQNIQELASDSEDEKDNDEEYNDSFTQGNKTNTYTIQSEIESKRQTARSIKTQSEYGEDFDDADGTEGTGKQSKKQTARSIKTVSEYGEDFDDGTGTEKYTEFEGGKDTTIRDSFPRDDIDDEDEPEDEYEEEEYEMENSLKRSQSLRKINSVPQLSVQSAQSNKNNSGKNNTNNNNNVRESKNTEIKTGSSYKSKFEEDEEYSYEDSEQIKGIKKEEEMSPDPTVLKDFHTHDNSIQKNPDYNESFGGQLDDGVVFANQDQNKVENVDLFTNSEESEMDYQDESHNPQNGKEGDYGQSPNPNKNGNDDESEVEDEEVEYDPEEEFNSNDNVRVDKNDNNTKKEDFNDKNRFSENMNEYEESLRLSKNKSHSNKDEGVKSSKARTYETSRSETEEDYEYDGSQNDKIAYFETIEKVNAEIKNIKNNNADYDDIDEEFEFN